MCPSAEDASREAMRGSRKGDGCGASAQAAQAALTDKFLWLFPPLELPDRSWKLVFFVVFVSFVDDISKTPFPINTRKLYLKSKTLNI